MRKNNPKYYHGENHDFPVVGQQLRSNVLQHLDGGSKPRCYELKLAL
jgi:hypothetical protein